MKAYTQNNIKYWLWLVGIILLFSISSCSNTKRLSEGNYLLIGNGIEIKEDNLLDKNDMKNELKKLARQQTNKKFLGFWRLRLSTFNLATRKDDVYEHNDFEAVDSTTSKFNQWLRTKIGEPPVIFDSTLMVSSQIRMQSHLHNNGYFNAEVTSDFELKEKKKKVKAKYYVVPNDRYYLRNVVYSADDPALDRIVKANVDETLLFKDNPYEAKVLEQERTRITNAIQNEGYFTFNREFIIVEIDTFIEPGNKADIYYTIKDPVDSTTHHKYYIGDVDFELTFPRSRLRKLDLSKLDSNYVRGILTILPEKSIRPKPIIRSIFFDEDSLYRKENYNSTLRRLNDLGVFRSVNVKFEPYLIEEDIGILNTKIAATLRKKQTFSIENEWNTDSKQSLGMELSTSYINRNIFRGADKFEFNLSGGLELQLKRNAETEGQSVVNTVELQTDFKFKLPDLIVPFRIKSGYRKRNNLPITTEQNSSINLSYEFERRLGFYTINNASIAWQHDWYATNRIRHIIEFPSLSLVAPNESSFSAAFLQTLDNFPSLRRSFQPQFIATLLNYTFIYNGQFKRDRHFIYFKGNSKASGNILHGIMGAAQKNSVKPYDLLGIDYSQFVKFDADLRYFINFKNGNTLANRFYMGLGVPYGNVEVLPFVEQFYGGGNQSLRAWNYRSIGPGGFDTRTLTGLPDQAGDVKLEFNTEFRFTIYKFVKAAFFVDVGNVWLLRNDNERLDAEFRFTRESGQKNSFIDELAVDMGIGVRLDFNFFVVRLDAALPIRDPAFEDGQRWQFDKIDLSKGSDYRQRMGLIIAIGYPF
ncbi:MAG: BamA/TamA family outer membrane protein [Chitinophagales bacterium]